MTKVEVAQAGVGRIIVGRLHPGVDLIAGLEAACDAHGLRFAAVLACYGSLSAAGFEIPADPARRRTPETGAASSRRARRVHGGAGASVRDA